MKISRTRCGCDCLNDVEPYPVNQDCYPAVSAAISCCPDSPLGPVMTVTFDGDVTAYEITRSATDSAEWSATAIDIGAGVSMDLTLTCIATSWTLHRLRYDATGTLSDVTYDVESVHCGSDQEVVTLISPLQFSQTDSADPFELVFIDRSGSGEPAYATVHVLSEEPTVPPENYVQEHTCCAACPEGSPTHYLVDFGCSVRAFEPASPGQPPVVIAVAPPIMRLTRDCLFGDDACHWTGRMEDAGYWSYAVAEAWNSGGPLPESNDLLPIDTSIQGCDCENDTGFDSFPRVESIATGFETWLPYNHSFAARVDWSCSSCAEKSVTSTAGLLSVPNGVHSQGECEILRLVSSLEPFDGNLTLPELHWDLAVDGVRTTLTFTGSNVTIVYTASEAWKCFGRNTMNLTSVTSLTAMTATPPANICVVPARSSRPPNPCETKEQQCACCDPGWDFISKFVFQCGTTLVVSEGVLVRDTCVALADGTVISAPCGCFRKQFTGECVVSGATVAVSLDLTIWCDGTNWHVGECCTVDGVTTCVDTLASFSCLCSVAALGIEIGGGCCCLFEEPVAPPDCSCAPPATLYADIVKAGDCAVFDCDCAGVANDAGDGTTSWIWNDPCAVDVKSLNLVCTGGVWTLSMSTYTSGCNQVFTAVSGTCSPFMLVFEGTLNSACCGSGHSGTITITISE